MLVSSTKGIVFKSIKYSETSLILEIFTRKFGMKSFIISGIRKSKSKISPSLFQIMNLVEIQFYDKRSQKLNRIKEGTLYHKYDKIPFEVVFSSIGVFILEVTRNAVLESEENSLLYDFIETWFVKLDSGRFKMKYFHIFYLIELTKFLGFYPLNNFSNEYRYFNLMEGNFTQDIDASKNVCTLEESKLLYEVFSADVVKVLNGDSLLNFNLMQRNNLLDILIKYYGIHLDKMMPIKSLEVLRIIMA